MKKPQNEPQATVRKISTESVRRPMMGFDGINDVKKNFFFKLVHCSVTVDKRHPL